MAEADCGSASQLPSELAVQHHEEVPALESSEKCEPQVKRLTTSREAQEDPHHKKIKDILDKLSTLKGRCQRLNFDDKHAAVTIPGLQKELLDILDDVGVLCRKLNGKAKHMAQLFYLKTCVVTVEDDKLREFAISYILRDESVHLNALQQAIEGLNDPKSFSKPLLDGVLTFRTLAGFYYDRNVLSELVELSKSFSHCEAAKQEVRLAVLMFLQKAGEYFERTQDSTLSLDADIPEAAKDDLKALRNKVSHLSASEIKYVCEDSTDMNDVFALVLQDIRSMSDSLSKIDEILKRMVKNEPDILWCQLLTLQELEEVSKSGLAEPWRGIKQLRNELTNVGAQDISGSVSISPEFMYQNYVNKRKDLRNLIYCNLLHKRKPEDVLRCFLKKDYRSYSCCLLTTESQDAFLRAIELHHENHVALKGCTDIFDTFIDERLHVSPENHKEWGNLSTMPNITQSKPCRKRRNLSKEYEEYKKNYNMGNAQFIDDSAFSWTTEPTSVLEKRFHIDFKTSITTKADKDRLRLLEIQKILSVFSLFRDSVKITADISKDIDVDAKIQAYKHMTLKESEQIRKAFNNLNFGELGINAEEEQQLRSLYEDFFDVAKKIDDCDAVDNVELLFGTATSTRDKFLSTLEKMATIYDLPFDVSSLKQQLEVAASHTSSYEFARRSALEEFKDKYRSHRSVTAAAKEYSRKYFKDYQADLCQTLRYADEIFTMCGVEDSQYKNLLADLSVIVKQLQNEPSFSETQDCVRRAKESLNALLPYSTINLGFAAEYAEKSMTKTMQGHQITILAHQYYVAAIYEMISYIRDYPELALLRDTIQIRHHLFHGNPLDDTLSDNFGCNRKMSEEISILAVAVHFILDDLARSLQQNKV